ncbi:5-oxoprolinase subunit PxpA [Dokdonia donghaensis]|uniref:LamB/YcsF family protein n=1 Tax=Dokdonia donghaensis DSW-1 TaxID=1300343 RepID=A0A0A2H0G3_9FLAO|nr:5-oxoprolinase subunit PxpA [Dokdonia donghaensis]ANH61555.1 LamB/YcsF family protein [Dokdonia donghaensis DSW-1]KGO06155.1 LamB/YcsF family protein [Dokdonia donghaensis DSW-1]
MKTIDINSDVGEGVGNEALLMPLLSSCNIACGGHAGDEDVMREVLAFAKAYNVKIGAHPSYPDKDNFGRSIMEISDNVLKESIIDQISKLKHLAEENGQHLHHVKPHGALYNQAAIDKGVAMLIIEAIRSVDENLAIYVPYKSVIAKLAKPYLTTIIEGFADRSYHQDYTLVSRTHAEGVLNNAQDVVAHVLPMIMKDNLISLEGHILPFKVDTICVHGDTENAIDIVRALRSQLHSEGIQIV